MTNDIRMTRGATPSYRATLEIDGGPIDLTGATVTWTAKHSPVDAVPVFVHALADNDETVVISGSPTAGIVILTPKSADTATLAVGDGICMFYDVKVVETSGRVSHPIVGRLFVDPTAS